MKRRVVLSGVMGLVVLSACGDDGFDDEAAVIEVAGGADQAGVVDTELAQAVSVRVLNAGGAALAGQVVSFVVVEGGGRVFAGTASTGAQGLASERWVLGTRAGPQALEARLVSHSGRPLVARIVATAAAGTPAALIAVPGEPLAGERARPLPDPVVVKLTDDWGNPVGGVSVAFEPLSGGEVAPGSVETDAAGLASAVWTLGTQVGTQTLRVGTAAGVSLTLSATAELGGPFAIAIADGDLQTLAQHTLPPAPLQVLVTDFVGDPVNGAEVWFASATAGAYIVRTPARTYSGTTGVASWRDVMHSAGTQQVSATVDGLAPALFTMHVTPAGTAFDGAFRLTAVFDDTPEAPYGLDFIFRNGVLAFDEPVVPTYGIVAGTLDAATGAVTLHERLGLSRANDFVGQLSVQADGAVTGAGTLLQTPTGRTGTWTAIKVHD